MRQLRLDVADGYLCIELAEAAAPLTCAYFAALAGPLARGQVFRITDARNQAAMANPIHVVQFGLANALNAERTPVAHETTALSGLTHARWTVSAARFEPGFLYGSFFVCMRDEPELDFGGRRQPDGQGFAAFGRVVAGHDTVRRLHAHAEADEMLHHPIPLTDARLLP